MGEGVGVASAQGNERMPTAGQTCCAVDMLRVDVGAGVRVHVHVRVAVHVHDVAVVRAHAHVVVAW